MGGPDGFEPTLSHAIYRPDAPRLQCPGCDKIIWEERPASECAQCTEKLLEILDWFAQLGEHFNNQDEFLIIYDESDSDLSDNETTDSASEGSLGLGRLIEPELRSGSSPAIADISDESDKENQPPGISTAVCPDDGPTASRNLCVASTSGPPDSEESGHEPGPSSIYNILRSGRLSLTTLDQFDISDSEESVEENIAEIYSRFFD